MGNSWRHWIALIECHQNGPIELGQIFSLPANRQAIWILMEPMLFWTQGIKGLGETAIQHGNIGFLKLDLFLGLLQISFKVQKEASKSPSKQLSPAKSPICGRSKSRSRSPSR
ncbi:unnamed protein product [Arabidopsis thaliana]|uniref:Uncharacterized protein n=1 Tax=Arabidopsis thaliana TaxID=3702 RepID=A0A654FL68_ARATH|nr:unnamed protein product [Arabidopsis thaliana]